MSQICKFLYISCIDRPVKEVVLCALFIWTCLERNVYFVQKVLKVLSFHYVEKIMHYYWRFWMVLCTVFNCECLYSDVSIIFRFWSNMFSAFFKTDQLLMLGKLAGGSPLSGFRRDRKHNIWLCFSQMENIKSVSTNCIPNLRCIFIFFITDVQRWRAYMSVHDAIFCTVHCLVISQNSMLIVLRHFIETVWWKTWSV